MARSNEIVIKPQKFVGVHFREIWRARELFYFLTWRDIKVRYKQTLIGASWAIIQPLVTMVIFTLFFNKVAGIKVSGIPYPIFSFAGLLFWGYFSGSLTQVSNSLLSNQGIVTKVYFPRIMLPIAGTLLGLVDFFFAGLVFAGLMVYYHIVPGVAGLLLLGPMLLLSLITALGLGCIFAALNVRYRDIRAAVPFVIQIGLFLTPIIYPVSLIPHKYQWLLSLNPMASVINTMRASLLHYGAINWAGIGISSLVALGLLFLGVLFFGRAERKFADII
ncbi:MAG TPA: ABC transporter permease [Candidatus Saccharimonadales bacterium]|nr:ABC transporter permease [Candidatus Saccharimonadales bacterium]